MPIRIGIPANIRRDEPERQSVNTLGNALQPHQSQNKAQTAPETAQAQDIPVQRRRGQRLLLDARLGGLVEHVEPPVELRGARQDAGRLHQPAEQEHVAGAEAAELGDVPAEKEAPHVPQVGVGRTDAVEEGG